MNVFAQDPVNYQLKIVTKHKFVPQILEWLEGKTDVVSTFEVDKSNKIESMPEDKWEVNGYFGESSNLIILKSELTQFCESLKIQVPEIYIEKLEDKNWVEEYQKSSTPIDSGGFYVVGSHVSTDLPKDKYIIKIDAGRAFGTGEHETTYGVLKILSELNGRYLNMLDMGCGSAILAIAMAKKWQGKILAADIDNQSVLVAKENTKNNGVDQNITCIVSDGFRSNLIIDNGPYNLVTANILANPLIEMARDMADNIASEGLVILSGFLLEQKKDIINAYQQFDFIREEIINNWCAMLLIKR
jgi:ribosomal protein L11 methyltransferase